MHTPASSHGVASPTPAPPATGAVQSAVSWSAIIAGAAAAAALSLILLILGTGLGLSSVSPWAFDGVSRETFGWSTIAWITLTSIAASGLGGYLAGRLRTRWVDVQTDESYFRDTAHGFLSWAVATLLTAAVLTSAIGAIVGTGAKAVGSATGAAATAAGGLAAAGAGAAVAESDDGDVQYWVDSLFRRAAAPADPAVATPAGETMPAAAPEAMREDGTALRAEIARIVVNSLRGDGLDPADEQYVAEQIAARTGISQAEARTRVSEMQTRMRTAIDEADTRAREAADAAREASAYAALWLFITLLIGAFFASLFATFGGRRRDL